MYSKRMFIISLLVVFGLSLMVAASASAAYPDKGRTMTMLKRPKFIPAMDTVIPVNITNPSHTRI